MGLLTVLQFSIVLDFMVISPLGAQLIRVLEIDATQFGMVVSAYAVSAGISGLLTAGFSDRFDRKKLLLFFYGGFILTTLMCGLAPNFEMLFAARMLTGLFGGVMSAISFAIISDVFSFELRGRVMGFIQMAFASSQVLGIPVGLYLANHYGWHSPFFMIVGVSVVVYLMVVYKMKPIDGHLQHRQELKTLQRLGKVVANRNYQLAFLTTFFIATGGFLILPFSSAFLVYNVGLTEAQLPILYLITGMGSIITGPLIGSLSDRVGKYPVFLVGSILAIGMILVFTSLGQTPLYQVVAINVLLFTFVSSRIIGSQAIMTAVPDAPERGAFMNINSSVQQLSGGMASMLGGLVLIENGTGGFRNFGTLGYIASAAMLICVALMYFINRYVKAKQ